MNHDSDKTIRMGSPLTLPSPRWPACAKSHLSGTKAGERDGVRGKEIGYYQKQGKGGRDGFKRRGPVEGSGEKGYAV
jgi:hypothetical protein